MEPRIGFTVMLIRHYDLYLVMQTFSDAICFRYSIGLRNIPMTCVCVVPFNDVPDWTSELLIEGCQSTPLTDEVHAEQTNRKMIQDALYLREDFGVEIAMHF